MTRKLIPTLVVLQPADALHDILSSPSAAPVDLGVLVSDVTAGAAHAGCQHCRNVSGLVPRLSTRFPC